MEGKKVCGNLESRISNLESIFWVTQTTAQLPANNDWLSEEERIVLGGFRFPKRRRDWLLGRWTAKQAICRFLREENASFPLIEIRAEPESRAPEAYWNGGPAGVSISISHSRDRGFCAMAGSGIAVGCDLEWIEPREENFAADYFTPEEISFVLQAPLEKALAVNLIWSAKESGLKTIRRGLSLDTRSIRIVPDHRSGQGFWNAWTGNCIESAVAFNGWWRAAEGYIYTIASTEPTSCPEELH